MVGTCSVYGGEEGVYGVLVEKPEGKRPVVDGRITLRWIFGKWNVQGMDWIQLAQDRDR
jgi:hypothetical protein